MSRYYVKMDVLEEKGDEVLASNKQLKEEIAEMKRFLDGLDWKGSAADSYKNLMKEKFKNLDKTTALIDVFGTFMKKGSEGFTEVLKDIENHFSQDDNLKVCSKCGSLLINGVCPNCTKVNL